MITLFPAAMIRWAAGFRTTTLLRASEATLLKLAYAFEQLAKVRRPPASTPPLAR